MSATELRLDGRAWTGLTDAGPSPASSATFRRSLVGVAVLALAVFDAALSTGAFIGAYLLRFSSDDSLPALSFPQYGLLAGIQGLLTTALLAMHGLYEVDRPRGWAVRFRGIVSATSTAAILTLFASYMLGDQSLSRLWLAVGWVISVVAVVLWRIVAQRLYTRLREIVAPRNRVLIVGANRLGRQLAAELEDLRIMGYVDNGSDVEHLDFPLLGPISQLGELVDAYAVDELVIALPNSRREQISRILARGFHRHVRVNLLPDLGELLPERFGIQELGGRHYVGFVPVAAVSWLKRAFDLVLVGAGIVAIAPLLLAVALAVKFDSPGPIFFRQERVGKHGRHFSMLKFRSMDVGADKQLELLRAKNEATGPLFKMKNDPRVTRVGRILRRWSIDELPQLFNVLAGDMSLVGPRPPLPSEVEEYEDWQLGRLRAVPGLTGLWQVSGRSEVPFHDMVRLDLHYIRNWSLALDFEILLRTIPAVLTNRGAY